MGCILLSTIKDWDTSKECFLGGDMYTDNECYKLKMQHEGQYLGSKIKKPMKNRHIRGAVSYKHLTLPTKLEV